MDSRIRYQSGNQRYWQTKYLLGYCGKLQVKIVFVWTEMKTKIYNFVNINKLVLKFPTMLDKSYGRNQNASQRRTRAYLSYSIFVFVSLFFFRRREKRKGGYRRDFSQNPFN